MADKKPEGGEGEAPPPRKKTKLLLFIAIGVLVIVLGGAGAAYFLLKKPPPTDEEGGEEPVATEKSKRSKKDNNSDAPPVFVKLEPFTVKLQTEQTEAYVQATPELRVYDLPVGDRIKQYMPEIRHKVLLLMSGKRASDLATPQGLQRLSNEIRDSINLILDGPKIKVKGKGKAEPAAPAEPADRADPDDSVQAVLFTSFIIQ